MRGSRSAMIVVAHVFSWPPVRLRHVLDQFSIRASHRMTKPAEPSLHQQCRYTCRAEAAPQFHATVLRLTLRMRRMLSLPKTSNTFFISYSYRPCLATVEQNGAHLVDPVLCTQLVRLISRHLFSTFEAHAIGWSFRLVSTAF